MSENGDGTERERTRGWLHRMLDELRAAGRNDENAQRSSDVMQDIDGNQAEARVIYDIDTAGMFQFRGTTTGGLLPLWHFEYRQTDYPMLSIDNIDRKEREQLYRFLKSFNQCPVCGASNHIIYLINFWFEEDPTMVEMKHMMLRLLDKFDPDQENIQGSISIGIPCCSCYARIFGVFNAAEFEIFYNCDPVHENNDEQDEYIDIAGLFDDDDDETDS